MCVIQDLGIKPEQVIAAAIKLRDAIETMEQRHKEELKPLKEQRDVLENVLIDYLNHEGGESFRCDAGTIFFSQVAKVQISDYAQVEQFVLENGRLDFFNKALNKDAIKQYLEDTGSLPPGVKYEVRANLNIRRKA